jgi:hypothetical protein
LALPAVEGRGGPVLGLDEPRPDAFPGLLRLDAVRPPGEAYLRSDLRLTPRLEQNNGGIFDEQRLGVAGAGSIAGSRSDPIRWRLDAWGGADWRRYRIEDPGPVPSRWVTSETVSAYLARQSGTPPTSSSEDLDAYRLIQTSTLPSTEDRIYGGGLALHAALREGWGVDLAARNHWSRSLGGDTDQDTGVQGGLSYRFHRHEALLVGATWSSLTSSPWTDDRVLPLVQWRVRLEGGNEALIGFPDASVHWAFAPGWSVDASLRFPDDGELALTAPLMTDFSWRSRAWYRVETRSAGRNALWREAITGTWFLHPLPELGNLQDDLHLFISDGGLRTGLQWRWRPIGLEIEAGPHALLPSRWRLGRDAAAAETVATLGWGFGGYAVAGWNF